MDREIPVVIPAYEPDERIFALLEKLAARGCFMIVVDDGSGPAYRDIFDKITRLLAGNGVVLRHDQNRGKGRALKTAFAYIVEQMPKAAGAVTADSDGQHTDEAIRAVQQAMREHEDALVLGARSFEKNAGEGVKIPWKSAFGNKLTVGVASYVLGIRISDTQTGLRGIPARFLRELLDVRGERFEFETEMLIASLDKYPIVEVPIETIYDSATDHQTHFNPLVDSGKIYLALGRHFIRFLLSSVSATVLDFVVFTVLCHFLRTEDSFWYISLSTVLARVVSAVYNYLMNYKVVFCSKENMKKAGVKYAVLAVLQMACSALLVTAGVVWVSGCREVVIKAFVDTFLFFVSYKIQQKYVFGGDGPKS